MVVQVAEGLRAEAAKTARPAPGRRRRSARGLRQGKWTFAYRYAMADYQLTLSVEKVQPQITVDSLVEAVSRTGAAVARSYGGLHDREGGRVPPGARYSRRLRRAARSTARRSPKPRPSRSMPIISKAKRKTRLVVNLARKAIGRVALAVQLQKDLDSARSAHADGQDGRDRLPHSRSRRRARPSGRRADW